MAFSLFPIVIRREIRVDFSRRCRILKLVLVAIFQNIKHFRCYCNAIYGITDLEHQNHEDILYLQVGHIPRLKILLDEAAPNNISLLQINCLLLKILHFLTAYLSVLISQ